MTVEEILKMYVDDELVFTCAEDYNINSRDLSGDTALHVACIRSSVREVEVLIENGADINARGDRGYTPLHWAIINDSQKIISILLSVGADVNITDDFGRLAFDMKKL